MKKAFYLVAAWLFSYRLFFEAVTARDTQSVVQKSQVDSRFYGFMAAAYVVQGVLVALALSAVLDGPEEFAATARVVVALLEKGLFLFALNLLFKMPMRTLALASILVSDVLSAILIAANAPVIAHLAVGFLLGFSLLRYMIKRP